MRAEKAEASRADVIAEKSQYQTKCRNLETGMSNWRKESDNWNKKEAEFESKLAVKQSYIDRLTEELGHHAAKEGQYRDALREVAQLTKDFEVLPGKVRPSYIAVVKVKEICQRAGFLQEPAAPVVTTKEDELQAAAEMMVELKEAAQS